MSIKLKDEGLVEKAELVAAIKGYEIEESQQYDKGIDFVATQTRSDDKILLRVITESKLKSGIVSINTVKEMSEMMEREDYDKGVLISKGFSKGARDEMRQKGIEIVSEKRVPLFKPQKVYLATQKYINELCQIKCGFIPEKESDCEGFSDGQYSCKIRLISDNADFHFEKGWVNLIQNDLEQLIGVHHAMSDKDIHSS